MTNENYLRSFFRKRYPSPYQIFMFIGLCQSKGLTYQTEIAKHFKIPLTTLNYQITKFKQEGLISKGLNLTPKGEKLFKFLFLNYDCKKLRAHNIQLKFKVIRCPQKFPDCFSKSIYQYFSNKRYRGIKAELKGMSVMFYSPHKIIVVLKDIYANTDEELSSSIQLLATEIKEILEQEFKGIILEGHEIAKIQSQHVAILDSTLAESYLLKNFTEENKDFAIDKSHGVSEIELTNSATALRDIMNLLRLEEFFLNKQNKEVIENE
jgi:hypothetical protein